MKHRPTRGVRRVSLVMLALLATARCDPRGGASALASQQLSDSVIREILARRVEAKQSVGLVVGIVEDGKSRFISYGTVDGAGTPPVDERTVFEIGSITKIFTGTLLADMVVRGEVTLHDAVARYLPPTVRLPSRNGRAITLLDLATHTSGLPDFPSNMTPTDNANPLADYTQPQLYAFLSSYVPARDSGDQYEYSNLGMALLGLNAAPSVTPRRRTRCGARPAEAVGSPHVRRIRRVSLHGTGHGQVRGRVPPSRGHTS